VPPHRHLRRAHQTARTKSTFARRCPRFRPGGLVSALQRRSHACDRPPTTHDRDKRVRPRGTGVAVGCLINCPPRKQLVTPKNTVAGLIRYPGGASSRVCWTSRDGPCADGRAGGGHRALEGAALWWPQALRNLNANREGQYSRGRWPGVAGNLTVPETEQSSRKGRPPSSRGDGDGSVVSPRPADHMPPCHERR